jgi:glutamate dehydrogenase
MVITAEERKVDLVDRLAIEARARVGSDLSESAAQFVRRYFALVAPDDIVYASFDTLLGGALSLWALGGQRKLGVAKVRIFNPTLEQDGWTLDHTVVEVINDDMPFLVDSITGEINRREQKIHLLLHPVVRVRRDGAGNRLEVTQTVAGGSDAIVESTMHIEIDQETDPAEIEALRLSLERVLAEVRMAVTDWRAMRDMLATDLKELETQKLPMPDEEAEEGRAFLQWLDSGNFIFLGYRRYAFETKGVTDYLPAIPESGLGILREVRPESIQRSKAPLSAEFSDYARKKDVLIITKANTLSAVHRLVPMDRIGVKRYDDKGNLVGENRFLGLFTSTAYSRGVREIPMLRLKVRRVIERAGLDPHSHNGKALIDILETFPRDEIFQVTDDDLFQISWGILQLQERQRVALFTRKDVFERFVSCYVYVPRDRYTAEFKERAKAILEEALDGGDTQVYDHVADSPLARGLFVVRTTPGKIPEIDVKRLEAYLAEAARTWSDRLLDELCDTKGEEAGIELHHRYKKAFPVAYSERFSSEAALYDIAHVEEVLATGNIVVDLYRHLGDNELQFHFKIVHTGAPVALSDIMPRLENMGLKVQSEVPYEVRPLGAALPVRIRDFSLSASGMQTDLDPVKEKFQETFLRVWRGDAESDGFNRLVLCAGLEWHEVVVLRAYAKYLRQIGFSLSESYIQQALANNATISRLLIQLFRNNFDPELGPTALRGAEASSKDMGRHAASLGIRAQIEDALEKVTNPDEDRILRMYVNLIDASLRTNYYQRDENGQRKSYLSFKLDSRAVKNLPLPRPMFEISVYSPTFEGIHLRGGKVARGGIRWSDRREDFRFEILGLVKAQMVKNVVIVPVGSKGGFVVKNPSADRETFRKEGIEAYKTFLRGLLDITDNLRGDEVVPPPNVLRRDPDDPYLVVAADKGTATFSDIANSISAEYGFWLGDAFASGGSAGYDHKEMGITARGGWEAVKRHFREMGINIQEQDFNVVGVGDMSGDVFGNALLLSPHIRLIGTFNHSHIFIDPNPDPAVSLAERQRMFDERLNWNGYNTRLLSKGGGVYERTLKTITVSEEARKLFELPQATLTPIELIRAILKANADLLWLGGIGTYVKASWEDDSAARDRTNDALRINANELRVKVVGEGANLGFTQRGRIEYALGGGRLNTDAIDNSAGVDTSDHEVNLKILLYDAIARGELAGIKERNEVLSKMTDDVAALVLRDNYEQTQAISVTHAFGVSVLDEQARFMRALERAGKLDRTIEGLPDEETLTDRHVAHIGLTRPEISVILAYAKLVHYEDLLESDLPDDPQLAEDLLLYFPELIRKDFAAAVGRHRLRREIIASYVTNDLLNRLRPTLVQQMKDDTGRSVADIARAFTIIRESFDLRSIWSEIESLDNKLGAKVQIDMLAAVGTLLERAMLWILRHPYEKLDIAEFVKQFRPRILALSEHLAELLPAPLLTALETRQSLLISAGIPQSLARRVASLDIMASALDIVRIMQQDKQGGENVDNVARIYFGLGARFGLDRLRAAGSTIVVDTPWQKAAVAALVDDLFTFQSALAQRVIAEANGSRGAADIVDLWLAQHAPVVERIDQTMTDMKTAPSLDIAMLTVASRTLRTLIES